MKLAATIALIPLVALILLTPVWTILADEPLAHSVSVPLVARDVTGPEDEAPVTWPPADAEGAVVAAYPTSRKTSTGALAIVARVYNGADTPLRDVRVDVTVRDHSGAIIYERFSLARPFVMAPAAEGVVSLNCDIDPGEVGSFELKVTEAWEAPEAWVPEGIETHLQFDSASEDWRIDRLTVRNTSGTGYVTAGYAVAYYDAAGRAVAVKESAIPGGLAAGAEVEVEVYLWQPGSLPAIATTRVFFNGVQED